VIYKKAGMDYLVLGTTGGKDGLEVVRRFKNEALPSFS
jgi:hypothetical protein